MNCSPVTREFMATAFLLSPVLPIKKGFRFLPGRDQRQMIRYHARFRNPEKAARPLIGVNREIGVVRESDFGCTYPS